MIEAVVSVVIERLGELILSEAGFAFSGGVRSLVDAARNDLRQIRCFLNDANERARQGDSVFENHVAEIREAAYDLEDVVATFVLKEALRRRSKSTNSVLGISFTIPKLTSIYQKVELRKLGSEIERISARISKSRQCFQESRLIPYYQEGGEASSSGQRQRRELRRAYSHTTEEDIVGFEEHIRQLTGHLISGDHHRIFSIYGMGGLGKTTLARKIYQSGAVRRHFDGLAWASISQQCQERDVWEGILIKLTSPSAEERKEMKEKSSEEIASTLYRLLKNKRCLVILDDVWTASKWFLLKAGFPVKRRSKSRILLTTRKRNVVLCAGRQYSFIYELQCLNEKESWNLFQKKVHFGGDSLTNPENHKKMKKLGRKMLKHCAGLPIAIVLLSGVLSSKESLHDWEMLDRNFELYKWKDEMLVQEDSKDFHVSSVLGLSYDELPNHLKLCFLYLAHFPNNFEIMATELCQIWAAEGFVSSEDMAYQCLVELVERSMVQVVKWGSVPGRIKTCTVHDLMRNLCLSKAEKENFLQSMHFRRKDEKANPLSSGKDVVEKSTDRRLAIYLDDTNAELIPAIKSRDRTLRSLMFFNSTKDMLYKKLLELIFKQFCLLRVLKFDNAVSCHVGKLPKGIGKLIHLRLLSLKDVGVNDLPSSIGNLGCLQTLDLRVRCTGCVTLPNVFWKLRQLRHLYLPLSYRVRKGKLRLDYLSSLQTLVNINLESSDWDDLSDLVNLTKLRVHIDQYGTEVPKLKSIDALEKLQSLALHTQSAEIDVVPIATSFPHLYKLLLVGNLVKLTNHNQFPESLVKLSLERSRLRSDPLAKLEKLPNLQTLCLDVDAYVGRKMMCSTGGFPQLENLSLSYLYNLKQWMIKEGALPRLCYLKIEGCRNLRVIPKILRDIITLKEIFTQWMPRDFNIYMLFTLQREVEGPSLVVLNECDSDNSGGSTSAVSEVEVERGAYSDIGAEL